MAPRARKTMSIVQLKDLAGLLSSTGVADSMKVLMVVGVMLLVVWRAARLYFQPDAPFNLLTPIEHRLRQRLTNLQEQMAATMDPLMLEVMAEEKSRMQFYLLHGIDAKASFRRELMGLYHVSGPRMNWTDVRQALPYLKYEDGRVVLGMNRIDVFFSWLLLGTAGLTLIFGVIVGTFAPIMAGLKEPLMVLVASLMGVPFLVVAWVLARAAIPVVRAQQMQNAVKRWRNQSTPAQQLPTPQDDRSTTAVPVATSTVGH
jgi:hypothetical protein